MCVYVCACVCVCVCVCVCESSRNTVSSLFQDANGREAIILMGRIVHEDLTSHMQHEEAALCNRRSTGTHIHTHTRTHTHTHTHTHTRTHTHTHTHVHTRTCTLAHKHIYLHKWTYSPEVAHAGPKRACLSILPRLKGCTMTCCYQAQHWYAGSKATELANHGLWARMSN